jgi:hypothetical protein
MLINKASLDAVFTGVKAVYADAFLKTESHLDEGRPGIMKKSPFIL